MQAPQTPPALQTPIEHIVPSAKPSPGQALFTPSQDSATSHSPTAPRQSVSAGSTRSGGHAGLVPVQTSGTSQTSFIATSRHVLPTGMRMQSQLAAHWLPQHISPAAHVGV